MKKILRIVAYAQAGLALLTAGMSNAADYSAVLQWSQLSAVSAAVPGRVERVLVQAGQQAKPGELLLVLDPAVYQAEVMAARAEVSGLGADEAEAKRNLDREQELYNRTITPTTELDAAKLRYAQAKAKLDAAQARLERARQRLAEAEVRAPFPAVVVERQAEPGVVVAQCQPQPLLTLARSDEMLARATLSPAQAAGLSLGAAATVVIGDKSQVGKVRSLRYVAGDKPGYLLDVAIPRPAHALAGQAATIKLP